jgi:hypothetical protein
MRQIAEELDQAKALAHEHHILTESSKPAEIGPMGATPIGQAPIAFALIVRKGGVDFIEAPIHYLGGFDDTARFSTSVEHDPALTGRRGVRLVFRATSRGLDPSDYKFKQFICEFGTAWNPEWVGTEQTRFFKLDGERLHVVSTWRIMPNWPEKGMQRSLLVFERAK